MLHAVWKKLKVLLLLFELPASFFVDCLLPLIPSSDSVLRKSGAFFPVPDFELQEIDCVDFGLRSFDYFANPVADYCFSYLVSGHLIVFALRYRVGIPAFYLFYPIPVAIYQKYH